MGEHTESERYFVSLILEMKRENGENHTKVMNELGALKRISHTPDDCPGVKRVEKEFHDYKEEQKTNERDEYWRGWGKEILKWLTAVGAGWLGGKA